MAGEHLALYPSLLYAMHAERSRDVTDPAIVCVIGREDYLVLWCA